ncbi:hypothetical protein VTK26DRAFT_5832 [Humicola hyalothermophila]
MHINLGRELALGVDNVRLYELCNPTTGMRIEITTPIGGQSPFYRPKPSVRRLQEQAAQPGHPQGNKMAKWMGSDGRQGKSQRIETASQPPSQGLCGLPVETLRRGARRPVGSWIPSCILDSRTLGTTSGSCRRMQRGAGPAKHGTLSSCRRPHTVLWTQSLL